MKDVLVSGASGFLGRYIIQALSAKKYVFETIGRHENSSLICDLSNEEPVFSDGYSLVIHAAGKAHTIPKTKAESQVFYDVNLKGTQNLCSAFDTLKQWPKAFVFISTVAVYGLDEGENITENFALKGSTPYAKSKIQAEAFLQNWAKSNGVLLTILRLPLVVGADAPGNLGAMINAIRNNIYFNIGKGKDRKSMVLAEDVADCIPEVAQIGGIFNLTDGDHPTFSNLSAIIAKNLKKRRPLNIPYWVAFFLGLAGNIFGKKAPFNSYKLRKITATLTFDDFQAKSVFGWRPKRVIDAFKLN